MLARLGVNAARAYPRTAVRLYATVTPHTTRDSIVDGYGKIIKLTDPNRPEMGDYPDIKPQLAQDRDPYKTYDDQQNRRNINDPVNIDDDYYDMWSPDYFQPVSDKTALWHNAIFFSLVFGFGATIWYFQLNPEKPAMPRSYPFGGLAKELGSGSAEADYFYRVKPDTTAEQELGFLANDSQVDSARENYERDHATFIKA